MFFFILQFFSAPKTTQFQQSSNSFSDILTPVFFFYLFLASVCFFCIIYGRKLLKNYVKKNSMFNRNTLKIMVPKERKSEGQGGQVGQEDRLEQIKEEIGITESFFSTIAGLRANTGLWHWLTGRQDYFSFETVVQDGRIYFYIDTPKKKTDFVEQQIHAQFPNADIERITDYNLFSENSHILGAYLYGTKRKVFPIKTYKTMDSDPMSGMLNVLARIREDNSAAAVQFVVRSAKKTWRSDAVRIVREVKKGKKFEQVAQESGVSRFFRKTGELISENFSKPQEQMGKDTHYQLSAMEEEMLKGLEEKMSKGGLEVSIRIITVSDNEVMNRTNLDNILNAFSQYNLYRYGNEFRAAIPRRQTQIIKDFIYRSFSEKYNIISNTEEIASLWHPPIHSTEAPNIAWLTGRSAPPPPNLPKEGLTLGYCEYRGTKEDVKLQTPDRQRHLYIIGKSGSGKSVTIANLAMQDVKAGHGVCIVDPHGDLVEEVLGHIPKERADDVIIFNPSDTERPIGMNMLEAKSKDQKDFAVQEMLGIFLKLFPPEMIGPMFEHTMRNVMLTLMANHEDPGTIIDIPRMLVDDDFVKRYLVNVTDPIVRTYWEKEMAQTTQHTKSEMLGYLVSKIGRFVGNEMMRNIMGQQKSGFDFREVMDNQKILLVNLAKGKTGEVNSKLIGLIVVAKLQMAAMGRADMEEHLRKDFYLYIDEFQNFTTDSIAIILSEARKYRLDLTVAHQYMGQLMNDKGQPEIRDAVLGNVGTMMVGRIGPDDSEILAKEFAPVFGSFDLLNTPQYSFYSKMLISNQASKPFLMRAYPPEKGNKELADTITQLSRLKYGRDKRIVEEEILERTKLDDPETKGIGGDLSEMSL
ncbi:MAG: type IV secretion system DNA-binding domain-containing protein [Candidatus Magasanikbacteria bacterium]|jgi:hypothetical protein|nr:type IV secretion system DNA-binding domain-containing protein [Candidatus Magasanikbacteria bacterium]MBT5262882.1 type IV secretion system DNA-binding domain-containing protein [Candidatus Magasanikbacteria bacterium]MBT5820037.1 type IV secretion system DNA-binding domain-containing protein [Candidatus Magasanikbacteria bacterium]MBT6294681.1 type IV secretion system DNA-binding domain-containing protein [Candidatus Magasanikbacteria bacterium]